MLLLLLLLLLAATEITTVVKPPTINNRYNNSSADLSYLLMLMGILASLAAFTMTDTSASDVGLTARISYMARRINFFM